MGPKSLKGSVLLRLNADFWVGSAARIIQEFMNEEVWPEALTSVTVSEISVNIDENSDI